MVSAIYIYAEGGGEHKATKIKFTRGLHLFLTELVSLARSKRLPWNLVACGSRNEAYSDFCRAIKTQLDAFNVLLVDSEAAVVSKPGSAPLPWQHLKRQDKSWNCPSGAKDIHCHLVVQCLEAWFLADRDTLKAFYGKGFRASALPPNPDIESVEKKQILDGLEAATAKTQTGKYEKRHAFDILGMLDTNKVRAASPYCERLFMTLETIIHSRYAKPCCRATG